MWHFEIENVFLCESFVDMMTINLPKKDMLCCKILRKSDVVFKNVEEILSLCFDRLDMKDVTFKVSNKYDERVYPMWLVHRCNLCAEI